MSEEAQQMPLKKKRKNRKKSKLQQACKDRRRRVRKRTTRNAEWHKMYKREYNKRPEVKERMRVYSMVAAAKRKGIITQQPCATCGDLNSQAHHKDYSKPLEVSWLCPQCHAREHKKSPFYGHPKYEKIA